MTRRSQDRPRDDDAHSILFAAAARQLESYGCRECEEHLCGATRREGGRNGLCAVSSAACLLHSADLCGSLASSHISSSSSLLLMPMLDATIPEVCRCNMSEVTDWYQDARHRPAHARPSALRPAFFGQ
jgi:hypothetical protein